MKNSEIADTLGLYTRYFASKVAKFSDRMIAGFQSTFSIDEETTRAYYRERGLQSAKKGDYHKAIAQLEPLLNEQGVDDVQVLLSLGVSMMHMGRADEGVKLLEQAYQKDKTNERIPMALGLAYTQVENYKKAIPLLKKVVVASSEHFNAWFRLGVAYDHLEDFDLAIQAFEAALELRPDESKLYSRIGYLYEQKGDRDKAVHYFKKASEQEDDIV